MHADRTRLWKQVLINLLSNAIKYNRPGGTSVTVDCSAHDAHRTRITVTDTGAGLSAEKLSQLFQSFNRLGQEAGAEEGTGIGLVVSKRLVELMDGLIGADSTVGVGSVFWIELPETSLARRLDKPLDTGETAPLAPAKNARPHTLLYVEDNPANLTLIEQLIARRSDMQLLTAGDAIRGIDIARTEQPEVILMDINLPGISGLEALKILADDPLTSHIPVIALSASAMPRDVANGLKAGFFRYLTKPVKVKELLDTLAEAFDITESPSMRI